MATTYTLPDITAYVGTFKVTIYSDIDGLTAPTSSTVMRIGESDERLNMRPGVALVETCQVEVFDDYATHTYGFWYRLLQQRCRIKIVLTENGVDTLYFYGVPSPQTVTWTEHYIGGSSYRRSAKFEIVSMAREIFNSYGNAMRCSDLLSAIYAQRIPGNTGDGQPSHVVSIRSVFSALLFQSGLNNSPDEDDVTFRFDGTKPAIQWKYPGLSLLTYTVDQLYIATNYTYNVAPINWNDEVSAYFSSDDDWYLENYYPSAEEFIKSLLKLFGFSMRITYDISDDRHKVELVQIGNAEAGTYDFGSPSESTIEEATDLVLQSVMVKSAVRDTDQAWVSGFESYAGQVYYGYEGTRPDGATPKSFDIDLSIAFGWSSMAHVITGVDDPLFYAPYWSQLWGSTTGAAESFALASTIYWRDYIADDISTYRYNSPTSESPTYPAQNAVASMLFSFFNKKRKRITRTYEQFGASLGGTTSHAYLKVGVRTSINDGYETATYFANRVVKIPDTGQVKVEWIEE